MRCASSHQRSKQWRVAGELERVRQGVQEERGQRHRRGQAEQGEPVAGASDAGAPQRVAERHKGGVRRRGKRHGLHSGAAE